MQSQPPISIHRDAKSLTSLIIILEVSNKHHWELNEILTNFCFDHNLWFSVVFEYYASIWNVPLLIHKWRFPSFVTLLYALHSEFGLVSFVVISLQILDQVWYSLKYGHWEISWMKSWITWLRVASGSNACRTWWRSEDNSLGAKSVQKRLRTLCNNSLVLN